MGKDLMLRWCLRIFNHMHKILEDSWQVIWDWIKFRDGVYKRMEIWIRRLNLIFKRIRGTLVV